MPSFWNAWAQNALKGLKGVGMAAGSPAGEGRMFETVNN